jgi:hypothetical protein
MLFEKSFIVFHAYVDGLMPLSYTALRDLGSGNHER